MEMFRFVAGKMDGWLPVFQLSLAELVVRIDKYVQNRFESLQAAEKTAAPPCQSRDKVPQVGVDALDDVGVGFITYVADVFAWKDHIHIAKIAVCSIGFCVGRSINDTLNRLRGFIPRHRKT